MSAPSAPSNGLRAERLDNGLTVLVRPVRTAPLVSVWCWYHVGSKDERPGTTGISHWVEHMNFKGTANISREEMKVWIERAGGSWNGYTWIDQTTYFETLAADSLDLALQIEAERMVACSYDPEEVESERTVIISELQGNQNSPEYLLGIEVTREAFCDHPYGVPTIGRLEDLRRITRDDLWNHYRTWYVPSNATLVVVGDVDADEALRRAEARFGHLDPGDPPERDYPAEPPQEAERRVVLERPGTTRYLQAAYPAPAATDADFVPLLVADALLSGGKGVNLWSGGFGRSARTTSPLYERLVDTELVSSISTAVLPTEQPYLYEIGAVVRDDPDEAEVEEVLFETMEAVGDGPIEERALRKAKNQVLTSLAFESEGVTQAAHQLGYFATIARHDLFDDLEDRVEAVTADEVRRVAASRWRPERRTVGWFRPQGREAPGESGGDGDNGDRRDDPPAGSAGPGGRRGGAP